MAFESVIELLAICKPKSSSRHAIHAGIIYDNFRNNFDNNTESTERAFSAENQTYSARAQFFLFCGYQEYRPRTDVILFLTRPFMCAF